MMRESGILMHITSLPGPYGVGCLGKEAFRFVDFLTTCCITASPRIRPCR